MIEQLLWLVPVAVLGAGLRDPRGGLVVLAGALPLFGSPPGGPYLASLDVAAMLAILTAWREGRPPPSSLDWPVRAFVVVSAMSLVPLTYLPPSWHPRVLLRLLAVFPEVEPWSAVYGWRAMANLLLGFGLYSGVRRAFACRPLRPLGVALTVGVATTLVVGLVAHAGLVDLNSFRTAGGPRWEGRVHSFFFHSGWLAEYLVLCVPLCVAFVLTAGRGRWLGGGIVALALLTIVGTAQRGSWFAVLGELLLAAILLSRHLLRNRQSRRSLLAMAVLAAALVAGVQAAWPGFFDAATRRARFTFKFHGRAFIWQVSAEMSAQRPMLGWGLGSFSPVYRQLHSSSYTGTFDWLTAHNQYLMLTTERGLLGLAAFALVGWAMLGVLVGARGSPRIEDRLLCGGLAVSFTGFLVYGAAQYLFFLKAIELLFWLMLGVGSRLVPRPFVRPLDRIAWVVMAAAVLTAAWRASEVEPFVTPGDRSFGFHETEESGERRFRWTGRYAAFRQTPRDGVVTLEAANGHPRPDHRVQIVVRVNGAERLRSELSREWQRFAFPAEPAADGTALVEIDVDPTFRPFQDYRREPALPRSYDIRSLGVAVATDCPAGGPGSCGD